MKEKLKEQILEEFDAKFLYRLNQIALKDLDVDLYADQEEWLDHTIDRVKEGERRKSNKFMWCFNVYR